MEDARTSAVSVNFTTLALPRLSMMQKITALRFAGITIPSSSTILNCTIQFTTASPPEFPGNVSLWVYGELSPSPTILYNTNANISGRVRTQTHVTWSPSDWIGVGTKGPAQSTANLSSIVQEIVNQAAWASGNSLIFFFLSDPMFTNATNATRYASASSSGPELWVTFIPQGKILRFKVGLE